MARSKVGTHCQTLVPASLLAHSSSACGPRLSLRLPMCGRVRLPEDVSELKVDLGLAEVWRDRYEPRWNVPPTCDMPVVTNEGGKRVLQRMRWGLIPFWAKDAKIGYSTFNARSDGLDTKPAREPGRTG